MKQYKRSGGIGVADMPLSNDKAQGLLNRVVEYKSKLFAEEGGEFYAFPKSMGSYYHGFRRMDLTNDEKNGIKRLIQNRGL